MDEEAKGPLEREIEQILDKAAQGSTWALRTSVEGGIDPSISDGELREFFARYMMGLKEANLRIAREVDELR